MPTNGAVTPGRPLRTCASPGGQGTSSVRAVRQQEGAQASSRKQRLKCAQQRHPQRRTDTIGRWLSEHCFWTRNVHARVGKFLSRLPMVGRSVIDNTGLKGFYGFSLDYAMTFSDDSAPDIFGALQEQLGLKLESAKRPVEIIVIDHVDKASEN